MLQTLEVKLKSTDSIQALESNTSLSTKILSSVWNVFSVVHSHDIYLSKNRLDPRRHKEKFCMGPSDSTSTNTLHTSVCILRHHGMIDESEGSA